MLGVGVAMLFVFLVFCIWLVVDLLEWMVLSGWVGCLAGLLGCSFRIVCSLAVGLLLVCVVLVCFVG